MESGYKSRLVYFFVDLNCGLVNCLRLEQIICLSLQVKAKHVPKCIFTKFDAFRIKYYLLKVLPHRL
jgi:hypothetical protein